MAVLGPLEKFLGCPIQVLLIGGDRIPAFVQTIVNSMSKL